MYEGQNKSFSSLTKPKLKTRKEYTKLVLLKILHKKISEKGVVRYFCSFKDLSPIHSTWLTEDEVNSFGLVAKNKLLRFVQRTPYFWSEGDPLFEEEYEPERILAGRHGPGFKEGDGRFEYLVKWTNMPYSSSMWDFEEDINNKELFKKFREINDISRKKDISFLLENKTIPQPKNLDIIKEKFYKHENQLRNWQVEGVKWLVENWLKSQGCILADEMGLGKTIQTIALISFISEHYANGPFLIVCPLSTLENWKRELQEWTDFNTIIYQGNKKDRSFISHYEWYFWDEFGNPIDKKFKFDVIICTYESIISNKKLEEAEWLLMIADEGHRLKNRDAKVTCALHKFKARMKLILTGTPVQNNVAELWTLLDFVSPGKFGGMEKFVANHSDLQDRGKFDSLMSKISPYIMRRLKDQIAEKIPPRTETIIEVELTSIQRKYYKRILKQNRIALEERRDGENFKRLVNIVMQLRKVCNHPYLIENAIAEITKNCKTKKELAQKMVYSSGKFLFLAKLLPYLRQKKRHLLIFSQMKNVLDLLEIFVKSQEYPYERIDGTVKGSKRQQAIDRFQKRDDSFLFLLTTRAGGFGINLSRADTVVIFDSDWNPQNDLQAQSRCHRIGQSRKVVVYRLVTSKTYEKEMYLKASKKLILDKTILQTVRRKEKISSSLGISKLQNEDLEKVLMHGANQIFHGDSDSAENFENEDIENILETRATTLNHSEPSSLQSQNLIASHSNLDITASDFWGKVLPKEKTVTDLINECEQLNRFLSAKQRRDFFYQVRDAVASFRKTFTKEDKSDEEKNQLLSLLRIASRKAFAFDVNQRALFRLWESDLVNSTRRRGANYDNFSLRKYNPKKLNFLNHAQIPLKSIKIVEKVLINIITTHRNNFWSETFKRCSQLSKNAIGNEALSSLASRSEWEILGFCFAIVTVYAQTAHGNALKEFLAEIKHTFSEFLKNIAPLAYSAEEKDFDFVDPLCCNTDSFPEFWDPLYIKRVKKDGKMWEKSVDVSLRLQRISQNKHFNFETWRSILTKSKPVSVPVFWWKLEDTLKLLKYSTELGVENCSLIVKNTKVFDLEKRFEPIKSEELELRINSGEQIRVPNILCRCKNHVMNMVNFNIKNLVKCSNCLRWSHTMCIKFYVGPYGKICSECGLPLPPRKILLGFLDQIISILETEYSSGKLIQNTSNILKGKNLNSNYHKKKKMLFVKSKLLSRGLSNKFSGNDEVVLAKEVFKKCSKILFNEERKYQQSLLRKPFFNPALKKDRIEIEAAIALRNKFFTAFENCFKNVCVCKRFAGKGKMVFCKVCLKWFHSECLERNQKDHFSSSVCNKCENLSDEDRFLLIKRSKYLKRNTFIFNEFSLEGKRKAVEKGMRKGSEMEDACQMALANIILQSTKELKLFESEILESKREFNGSFGAFYGEKSIPFEVVRGNLERGAYPSPNHFAEDVRESLRDLWEEAEDRGKERDLKDEISSLADKFENSFAKIVPLHQAGSDRAEEGGYLNNSDAFTKNDSKNENFELNLSSKEAYKIIEYSKLMDEISFCVSLGVGILRSRVSLAAVRPQKPENGVNFTLFDNNEFNYETSMPLWWDPPLHDFLVLEGIYFHGFFAAEQMMSSIRFKPALMSPEGVMDPEKIFFFENFLQPQFVLLRRLSYVCSIVIHGSYSPSPIPPFMLENNELKNCIIEFYERNLNRENHEGSNSNRNKRLFDKNDKNDKNGSLQKSEKKRKNAKENVKGVRIINLGKIVKGHRINNFHTRKWIFPAGFESERMFTDWAEPDSKKLIMYRSSILDNGGDFPIFQVMALSRPERKFVSATATGAWSLVTKAIKENSQEFEVKKARLNGHEAFGYKSKRVREMIEKLPGAKLCTKYCSEIIT